MADFKSKIPTAYYCLLTFLTFTVILFSTFFLVGRLDLISSVMGLIILNLLCFYLFGRYLCVVELSDNRISLKYLYPFQYNKTYEFRGVSELDFRADVVQSSFGLLLPGANTSINRSYYRLYLTDENGKLLDIKYNINEIDNKRLVKTLNKKYYSRPSANNRFKLSPGRSGNTRI